MAAKLRTRFWRTVLLTIIAVVVSAVLGLSTYALLLHSAWRLQPIINKDLPWAFVAIGKDAGGAFRPIALPDASWAIKEKLSLDESREAIQSEIAAQIPGVAIPWAGTTGLTFRVPRQESEKAEQQVNERATHMENAAPPFHTRLQIIHEDDESQIALVTLRKGDGTYRFLYRTDGAGITPLSYGKLTLGRMFYARVIGVIAGVFGLPMLFAGLYVLYRLTTRPRKQQPPLVVGEDAP